MPAEEGTEDGVALLRVCKCSTRITFPRKLGSEPARVSHSRVSGVNSTPPAPVRPQSSAARLRTHFEAHVTRGASLAHAPGETPGETANCPRDSAAEDEGSPGWYLFIRDRHPPLEPPDGLAPLTSSVHLAPPDCKHSTSYWTKPLTSWGLCSGRGARKPSQGDTEPRGRSGGARGWQSCGGESLTCVPRASFQEEVGF